MNTRQKSKNNNAQLESPCPTIDRNNSKQTDNIQELINQTITYVQNSNDLVCVDYTTDDATDHRVKKMAQVAIDYTIQEITLQKLADEFIRTKRAEKINKE